MRLLAGSVTSIAMFCCITSGSAQQTTTRASLPTVAGCGGTVSDSERARLAVTKRIKAALTKIRDANPDLARHLNAAITTGYFCSYAPKADTPTSWSLE